MILSTTSLTGVTAKPSLFDAVDYVCGFSDATSGANAYPYADRLRNVNKWLYKFAIEAWKADGSWNFDDSNFTTLPISTTTVANGQRDYTLPTDLLKIERVSILNLSGDYIDLDYLDKRTLPELQNEDAGLPTGYYLIGDSLFLNPKPDTSVMTATAGLRIIFKREIKELTNADASVELGIPEAFTDFIVNGVAREHCVRNDMNRLKTIDVDIERLKVDIKDFYRGRNTSENQRMTRKIVNYE